MLLIEKGALVNVCDGDGRTALRYACGKGFKDIVQVLIDNGAFLDECATNNTTSLDVAELYGHKEIMDLLLLNGAEKKERFINRKSDNCLNILLLFQGAHREKWKTTERSGETSWRS